MGSHQKSDGRENRGQSSIFCIAHEQSSRVIRLTTASLSNSRHGESVLAMARTSNRRTLADRLTDIRWRGAASQLFATLPARRALPLGEANPSVGGSVISLIVNWAGERVRPICRNRI